MSWRFSTSGHPPTPRLLCLTLSVRTAVDTGLHDVVLRLVFIFELIFEVQIVSAIGICQRALSRLEHSLSLLFSSSLRHGCELENFLDLRLFDMSAVDPLRPQL